MKTLHFSIIINAPKEKVWSMMLEPEGYKAWTSEFTTGSYYEGSWEQGKKMRFLAPDGQGMVAVLAENRPLEFLSIKHLGSIKDGVEDTDSPEIKAWAPAFENYTYTKIDGKTELQVDSDFLPEYEEMMQRMWPKALARLKSLCE